MEGYSPKLPLVKDPIDGLYSMNKTALDSIKQDFFMLLLTNPGERIMNPDYGVGLRQLLFSQSGNILEREIEARIRNQTNKYMNFITIKDINFQNSETEDTNSIYFSLEYYIPSLNLNDELNLSIGAN